MRLMSSSKGLWSRSSAWRWTVAITLLTTVIALLVNPWRDSNNANTNAYYTPPSSKVQSQQNGFSLGHAAQNAQYAVPKPRRQVVSPATIQTFDIPVTQSIKAYSPNTEMHVIGIYKGAPPAGESDAPWWSKCGSLSHIECHRKYAGKHTRHTVEVHIERNKPVVLSLMAYEPVTWNIHGGNTDIETIILGGYYGQEVIGISEAIPVKSYAYKSSACKQCTNHSESFYAYKRDTKKYQAAVSKLRKITGLTPTSFQGSYQANSFHISGSIINKGELWSQQQERKQRDPYTGMSFIDSVHRGGGLMPLPEGTWQGIVFERIPTDLGQDDVLILALIEKGVLAKLIASRVRISKEENGFPEQTDCTNKIAHVNHVDTNQQFGNQSCYWLQHNTDPWSQPVFKLAAARLADIDISLPETVLVGGFHNADKTTSDTTIFYINPEMDGISTVASSWLASPWHPKRIKSFPDKEAILHKYIQWMSVWYQIYRASNKSTTSNPAS